MLVRHDADRKIYLYDFLRTKKEMSSPLQQNAYGRKTHFYVNDYNMQT